MCKLNHYIDRFIRYHCTLLTLPVIFSLHNESRNHLLTMWQDLKSHPLQQGNEGHPLPKYWGGYHRVTQFLAILGSWKVRMGRMSDCGRWRYVSQMVALKGNLYVRTKHAHSLLFLKKSWATPKTTQQTSWICWISSCVFKYLCQSNGETIFQTFFPAPWRIWDAFRHFREKSPINSHPIWAPWRMTFPSTVGAFLASAWT